MAFVVVQESVEDAPAVIEEGLADKVQVGAPVPPLVVTVIPALATERSPAASVALSVYVHVPAPGFVSVYVVCVPGRLAICTPFL